MGELVDHRTHLAAQLRALGRITEESLRFLHVPFTEALDAANRADQLAAGGLLSDREQGVRHAGHCRHDNDRPALAA